MVMTDPLCECKERVLADRKAGINIPSRLFTVATLTGKEHNMLLCHIAVGFLSSVLTLRSCVVVNQF